MSYLKLLAAPKDAVLGINRRNTDLVQHYNPRRYFPLANDKLLTKEILTAQRISVPDTLTTFKSFFELKELDDRLKGLAEFVIKPAQGHAGRGILVISDQKEGLFLSASGDRISAERLRRHIADVTFGVYTLDRADVAIVEPRLRPCFELADIYPRGLSDIRIILVEDRPALGMIRVPTDASGGRANLHQGAIGLAVDISSGKISQAWLGGRRLVTHPDTGRALVGWRVADWERIVEISIRSAGIFPMKYLGVDIVIDRELGPVILEVNVRPGLEIQNVNGVGLQALLRRMGCLS